MTNIHFFMQGKGGSGKTTSSSFFTEYVKSLGHTPVCYDLDPINHSFLDFKGHGVRLFDITDSSTQINTRLFDKFAMEIMALNDTNIVIDTGAATFLPLLNYVKENDLISVLEENAKVFLHVPVAGGAAFKDTVAGLYTVLVHFPNIKIIVWKNFFFGELLDVESNKSFEDTKLYQDFGQKLFGIIEIPNKDKSTFGVDIERFLSAKLSLEELPSCGRFGLFPMARINRFYQELFSNIQAIDLEKNEQEDERNS